MTKTELLALLSPMPDDAGGVMHEMTVSKLKELLSTLEDTDILVPNAVRNLLIVRKDKSIGFIDFLDGHPALEFWEGQQ